MELTYFNFQDDLLTLVINDKKFELPNIVYPTMESMTYDPDENKLHVIQSFQIEKERLPQELIIYIEEIENSLKKIKEEYYE